DASGASSTVWVGILRIVFTSIRIWRSGRDWRLVGRRRPRERDIGQGRVTFGGFESSLSSKDPRRRCRMLSDDEIGRAWLAHRPYLIDLAFRMLGDIGAAEDVVQEVFFRLVQTPVGSVNDARGWLIVVT